MLLMLSLGWTACTRQAPQAQAGDRPWAFRSVLDETPRVLTVVLHPRLSVAYHTESGSLFKAWPGQLDLNGAVYTGAHGPQPTTIGGAFIMDTTQAVPWRLLKGEALETPTVQYLGHAFEDTAIVLSYALSSATGERVVIEEIPTYHEGATGPGLTRTYRIADNPAKLRVQLHLGIDAQAPFTKIYQNGDWEESLRTEVGEGPDGFQVSGILTLNQDKPTEFTVFLAEDMLKAPVDTTATLDEQMTALFESSGCYSCHHPKNQAVGPSYAAIKAKYEANEDNITYLTSKVVKGGAGNWGETAMIPHPHIDKADITRMVRYIMGLDGTPEPASDQAAEPEGVALTLYQVKEELETLPALTDATSPYAAIEKRRVRIMVADVLPVTTNFVATARTKVIVEEAQTLKLKTRVANGGVRVKIEGKTVIDAPTFRAGRTDQDGQIALAAGTYELEMQYFAQSLPDYKNVTQNIAELFWYDPQNDWYSSWRPPVELAYDPTWLDVSTQDPVETYSGPKIPGSGLPLVGPHPAFTLSQARPSDFKPRVGGLDFMSDGRVVVSTWDQVGAVYILGNVNQPDPEKITVTQVASGLAEPLGLKVVDDEIYVLQKQELTQLVDHDGDMITDEYRTISNDWVVTNNFHEFAFGLLYQDGHFFANMAIGILPGGKSAPNQSPDRGKTIKINKETGEVSYLTAGLRTPNGIGFGTDGEIFVLDNQGDWLPANKIAHVREGAFFGNRAVNIEQTKDLPEDPPAVWLPQDEIGNSPGQLVSIDKGPYAGQMIYGEVTHGGIKRAFVEKIKGQYQGVVFRWMQGFDAGVNRLAWAPDGSLYVGQIGVSGNWGHYDEDGMGKFGLQKLTYNEQSVFEMLAVRAKNNGMEIEFTEPLREGEGNNPADYMVKQWGYKPTGDYGGPKIGEETLTVTAANVSPDRRRVFLELSGMEANKVVYIRLQNPFISADDHDLWTTEAWYTLNQIPAEASQIAATPYQALPLNNLTEAEKAAGWKSLFNGKNTQGWHKYGGGKPGSSWQAKNGSLVLDGPRNKDGKFVDGDDLISDEVYENFELRLEWKISEGGNSGIFYFIQETDEYNEPWNTAPEMQILDDARHKDRWFDKHRSGDLYDLIACKYLTVRPAGNWNQVRIIARAGKVQQWLNGYKVVSYDMNDPAWKEMIANSKFKKYPGFGAYQKGRIGLQDHDNVVSFRNIKIRTLSPVQ